MVRRFGMLFILVAVVAVMSAGCGSGADPEAAKKMLADMKTNGKLDDVSETNFVYCAQMGDIKAVQLYIDSGMDVNAKNASGRTPLMGAAAAEEQSPWFDKNAEMIKLLLKKGADVNAKDNEGISALKMAQEMKRPAVAQMLTEAGAKE